MKESCDDIFARIAVEKGFLDDRKQEQVRVLQRLARREGKAIPFGRGCLLLELLTPEQVRGIERGTRYYVVRKADKIYGKLAVQKKYVDADTVEHCLERQHRDYLKKRRLVRLSKLLLGLEAIPAERDAELRKLVAERLSPEESREAKAADAQADREDQVVTSSHDAA